MGPITVMLPVGGGKVRLGDLRHQSIYHWCRDCRACPNVWRAYFSLGCRQRETAAPLSVEAGNLFYEAARWRNGSAAWGHGIYAVREVADLLGAKSGQEHRQPTHPEHGRTLRATVHDPCCVFIYPCLL